MCYKNKAIKEKRKEKGRIFVFPLLSTQLVTEVCRFQVPDLLNPDKPDSVLMPSNCCISVHAKLKEKPMENGVTNKSTYF